MDFDAQGYKASMSHPDLSFPDADFASNKSAYVNFWAAEGGASKAPSLAVTWTVPCSIHHAFVRFSGGKGASNKVVGNDLTLALTDSGIASDTALVMQDYQDTYPYNTELSERFPINAWIDCFSVHDGSWTGTQEGHTYCEAEDGNRHHYNYWGLNERGKVYINDTGSTNFVMRGELDMDYIGNVNPSEGRGTVSGSIGGDYINGSFYEATADERPELVVVHGSLTPTSIGTAGLFQVAGKTIIININGANFNNPLSVPDKQAILDGITGSLATATDWNTAVRDIQTTGTVAGPTNYNRTVTVTLEAAPTYNPSAVTETISIIIPASVIDTNTDLPMLPGSTFQVDQIPFGLTSISPTMAGNSSALILTVNGLGLPGGGVFTGSEAIELIKSGAPASPISCDYDSGAGNTTVNVSCPVTGVEVGLWSVKATDSGGLN